MMICEISNSENSLTFTRLKKNFRKNFYNCVGAGVLSVCVRVDGWGGGGGGGGAGILTKIQEFLSLCPGI